MKNNKLDFSGQRLYIGIDVHKKSWNVTIILNGMKVKSLSMNPKPEELYNYLLKHYPRGEYFSVYEAGFSGFWADRQLRSLGINNIVVNPADIPTKSKERRRKTDLVDSTKLARELSVGHLEGIYVLSENAEALRALVRLRRQLVNDQTRQKNRIKSLLLYLGYQVDGDIGEKNWSNKYLSSLENLDVKHEQSRATLTELLNNLRYIREQLASILKQLREHVRKDKKLNQTINLLMSIPGIGFVLAVTLCTEIVDINRFRKLDQLASFVGLSPSIYSSAEKEVNLGITKQSNKYLRNYLIESAWVAIRRDPALQLAYGKLCQRMPPSKAIIRICKKLLNRIRYVWSNQQEYVLSIVQ